MLKRILQRFIRATGYSLEGLKAAWVSEEAFRLEVIACLPLLMLLCFLELPLWHKALLASSLVLVLLVELLNTAIESVVYMVSPDPHPLAKIAKDTGSAAVLASLVITAMVWGSALWALI